MNRIATIYEINTATFLTDLSKQYTTGITLASVPDEAWDELATKNIDTVWLMGIWQRSDIARDMARTQDWIHEALPDATNDDILGSAYSIAGYQVDDRFGGNEGLAIARRKLRNRGIGLMLDYVPNHVAIDHPWTREHPEYFIRGSEKQYGADPEAFTPVEQTIFAKAKDPNFPVWSDVLQLNAFSDGLRQSTISTLNTIAQMCDAVRCDMAMLLLNDVFQNTWGKNAGKRPHDEFWSVVIGAVKTQHPEFVFLAEAYWDKEPLLIKQGFDFCYDKKMYDYLIEGKSSEIQHRLQSMNAINGQLFRFIENHDEERAAQTMTWERHRVAAVIMATLPGIHLYHEGQLEGYRRRVPVQLGRRYIEPLNQDVQEFYTILMATIREQEIMQGEWRMLHVHDGFLARHDILAWSWTSDHVSFVVVANFSDKPHRSLLSLTPGLTNKSAEHIFGTIDITLKGKKAIVHAAKWSYGIIKITTDR